MGEPVVRLDWRDYQTRLNRIAAARRRTRRMYRCAAGLTILLVIGFWVIESTIDLSRVFSYFRAPEKIQTNEPLSLPRNEKRIDKKEVQTFLNGNAFVNLTKRTLIPILKGIPIMWSRHWICPYSSICSNI
jgi:hypothetical protein